MKYQIEESPGFDLMRTANLFKAEFARQLAPYDVTPVQFAVLGLLWKQDGLFQHEIAEKLKKDRPNVTRILAKMEKKALISRHKDPQDRRAILVKLAEEGNRLQPDLEELALGYRKQVFHNFTKNEQHQLKQLLAKAVGNLI